MPLFDKNGPEKVDFLGVFANRIAMLQAPEVKIVLDLADGDCEATVWTCDINENYVVLNGSYMT